MNYNDLKPELEKAMDAAGICDEWSDLIHDATNWEEFFRTLKRKHNLEVADMETDLKRSSRRIDNLEYELECKQERIDELEEFEVPYIPNNSFLDSHTLIGQDRIELALKIAERYDIFQLQELCKTLKVA